MLLLEVKNDTEVGKIHAADKFFREFERGLLMCLFTIDCLCDSDRMRGVKRVLIECLTVAFRVVPTEKNSDFACTRIFTIILKSTKIDSSQSLQRGV